MKKLLYLFLFFGIQLNIARGQEGTPTYQANIEILPDWQNKNCVLTGNSEAAFMDAEQHLHLMANLLQFSPEQDVITQLEPIGIGEMKLNLFSPNFSEILSGKKSSETPNEITGSMSLNGRTQQVSLQLSQQQVKGKIQSKLVLKTTPEIWGLNGGEQELVFVFSVLML